MASQYVNPDMQSTDSGVNPYDNGSKEWYVFNNFKEYGYTPSRAEVQTMASSWDDTGGGGARGAIGNYMLTLDQQKKNDPYEIEKRRRSEAEAGAPQHFGSIDQMFQGTLGRAATDAERKHFGSLLASGQIDEYGIGQFINALPENVQRQDKQFREGLSGDLQKQDAQYYNEQIMPGIQSAFANQGRDPRSSAFANSLALAAQGQNRQRESFLSNLSAQQYAGSQGLAQRDYMNSMGGYQGLQDYSRNRSAQLADSTTGRMRELQDYSIQRQTYDDYLRRYGKKSNTAGLGSMIGGLAGAGLGMYFGGPAGGALGGSLGSSVGGYSEGLF